MLRSVLTLLLTVLRPVIRGYQYLNERLSTIKKEVKYPREDALELANKIKIIETSIKKIKSQLDIKNPDSLVGKQKKVSQENRLALARQTALLEEYQAENTVAHERLSREAQNVIMQLGCAISSLSEDSQFLGHVREIIRFVKTA